MHDDQGTLRELPLPCGGPHGGRAAPPCRGEPFIQGPGALRGERPVQLLTLALECLLGGLAGEWRPKYCAASAPIRVKDADADRDDRRGDVRLITNRLPD
jgi:hypothetical protein